jgi:hypothetical protein
MMRLSVLVGMVGAGTGGALLAIGMMMARVEAVEPTTEQLQAARQTTRMLDDLYKTAIVTVTDIYVEDATSVAAATAFQPVFRAMKQAKHHEVRLVDGLGDPINPDNAAADPFEKEAVRAMMAGQATFEKVETIEGQAYLRTMTSLPMVMEKCVLCHENYRGQKLVGGVSYKLPLTVQR